MEPSLQRETNRMPPLCHFVAAQSRRKRADIFHPYSTLTCTILFLLLAWMVHPTCPINLLATLEKKAGETGSPRLRPTQAAGHPFPSSPLHFIIKTF